MTENQCSKWFHALELEARWQEGLYGLPRPRGPLFQPGNHVAAPPERVLFVWKLGGAREPAGPRRSQESYCWLFWAVLVGFPWFPMVRWCGIRVIEQNGKSPLRLKINLAFKGHYGQARLLRRTFPHGSSR